MRILVLGLGTAGLYAAKWARNADPRAEIVVVERRTYPTFSPCGIPLAIEGLVSFESLKHPFPVRGNTRLLLGHEVVSVDLDSMRARVTDGSSELELSFDRLVFAPGAEPFVPPVPGAGEALGKDLFTIRVVEDGERLVRRIEEKGATRATVVGAGPIGCEISYALARRGLKVHLVEMLDRVFPRSLDPDMASHVEAYLRARGIEVRTGCPLEEVVLDDGSVVAVRACGERIPTDIVVMATGVRACTGLLEGQVDVDKGILVDERMETSREGVFAAGDVAVVRHRISGEMVMVQLASAAMRQGVVAGINAAGGDATYSGALGTFSSAMGAFEAAATGIRTGKSVKIAGFYKPEWAGGERVWLKLFLEGDRIVGAQAVGPRASAEIDVVAALIHRGATVDDALMFERSYCPGVSELNMPLSAAGEIALRRKLRR